MALNLLGQLAFQQGELSRAEALLTESARLASEVGDQRNIAQSRLLLAGLAAQRGDYAVARQRYAEGLAIALDIEHTNYIASGLKGLGCVAVVRSQLGEPAFEEARARGRTMTAAQALASHEVFAPQATQRLPPAQAVPGSFPAAPAGHPSFPAGLTAREVEVLRLVAQGLSDAQVAEQLVISPRTVNWHLTSIYSKLGVSSRSAATRYAIEQHLM